MLANPLHWTLLVSQASVAFPASSSGLMPRRRPQALASRDLGRVRSLVRKAFLIGQMRIRFSAEAQPVPRSRTAACAANQPLSLPESHHLTFMLSP